MRGHVSLGQFLKYPDGVAAHRGGGVTEFGTSCSFARPRCRRMAVKMIDHSGDEVSKMV